MNKFPQPDVEPRHVPDYPKAVLYQGKWWWGVEDAPNESMIIERHLAEKTERITVKIDELESII